jgi:carbon monoxide dehydrogenase subunit G
MKITGNATLMAPVSRVYDALNDPTILVRTIPGCHQLEETGQDSYRMTVHAGVASIKGVYQGEVRLSDHQPPASFRMRAVGSGAPGTVDADVLVRLTEAPDGGTLLEYDADAVVGGMVGGVGQRMLTGVAKKTAGEFFQAVDGVLNGVTPPAVEPSNAQAAGRPTPTAVGEPRPAVFSAPAPSNDGGLGGGFTTGVLVGAAIALVGALVGARAARFSRCP